MNTVVPLPPNDGSQPGPSFVVPPASKVRVAPISESQAKASEDNGSITGGAGAVTGEVSRPDAGRSASATSERMDATVGRDRHPILTPQASSPSFRATQASSAGDCVPPSSIDTAFFAAWREPQGTTIDAEPRASR